MLHSINKKKIYFYLFILIFLTTTFNLSFIDNFKKSNLLNKINIEGLSKKEKEILNNKLKTFLNINIFLLDENKRVLSVSVQLSNPSSYKGGELIFDNTEPMEDAQGTVIIFPSNLYHRVNPILSGTRYSLVQWFKGQ